MSSRSRLPVPPVFLEDYRIDPVFLGRLQAAVQQAADVVMAVYGRDFDVAFKDDHSPATEADTQAEAILTAGLKALTPDIPIIAEEAVSAGEAPPKTAPPLFWLVDPLDGTKEFVGRNGEFTVNVGLIQDGEPVFGIVHCPALETVYWGAGPGTAHMRTRQGVRSISCRRARKTGAVVIASRRHGDAEETAAFLDRFLSGVPIEKHVTAGSSLKFCKIAEGLADVYPRLGPTHEWDTAAAHAVLRAAGGDVRTLEGDPLGYGKAPRYKNPFFVACGPGW